MLKLDFDKLEDLSGYGSSPHTLVLQLENFVLTSWTVDHDFDNYTYKLYNHEVQYIHDYGCLVNGLSGHLFPYRLCLD